jgi:hypothetical protein
VGGPWGYDEFLAAMADPAHPEHEHYRGWLGGPFDPAAFDPTEVNAALAELAWRPLAASTRRSASAPALRGSR